MTNVHRPLDGPIPSRNPEGSLSRLRRRATSVLPCLQALILALSLAFVLAIPSRAHVDTTQMWYVNDVLGRMPDGRLLVQRYDSLCIVRGDMPGESAKGIAGGFSRAARLINVTCFEANAASTQFCLVAVEPLMRWSALVYGSVEHPRKLMGTPDNAILDAWLNPDGVHVRVLRSRREGEVFYLELHNIDMDGNDALWWSVASPHGRIHSASMNDTRVVYATQTEMYVGNQQGVMTDSVTRLYEFVHVTSAGGIMGLSQNMFCRYDAMLQDMGDVALPDGALEQVRALGDEAAISTSTWYALLRNDGTYFSDTLTPLSKMKCVIPDGRGGVFFVRTEGVLLTVHPERPEAMRYQVECRRDYPRFSAGWFRDTWTTFAVSVGDPLVSWYNDSLHAWIVMRELMITHEAEGHSRVDVRSGRMALITYDEDFVKPSEMHWYDLTTYEHGKFDLHDTYTNVHMLRNASLLFLQSEGPEHWRSSVLLLDGTELDTSAFYFGTSRVIGDTAVVGIDYGSTRILSVNSAGTITACSDEGASVPSHYAVAGEQHGRILSVHNDMLWSMSTSCTDPYQTPTGHTNITGVITLGDSTLYLQENKRIIAAYGRVLLEIPGNIQTIYADSQRVFVATHANSQQLVFTLTLNNATGIEEEGRGLLPVASAIVVWDGERVTSSSATSLPSASLSSVSSMQDLWRLNQMLYVYTTLGEFVATCTSEDTMPHMPPGTYVLVAR